MEGRAKVTKEVLCEEARFILANVMAEARYGRQNRYDDIRRVCEGAVSIPFPEYIAFLERSGYLRHDQANESLEVTPDGTFQAWRYTDMSSLAVEGGRKKLIGRDFMWLRGNIAPGNGTLTWLLPTGYYEHNMPIGKAAEDACRRAQLDRL